MSEPSATQTPPDTSHEDKSFAQVLGSLVGKKVTIVNPESYEATGMGTKLKEGTYEGTVSGLGQDFLVFNTSMAGTKKEGGTVAVKQFIPTARIKRISVMKAGILVHI